MSALIEAGDTVLCVDATSKTEWAEWYSDPAYSEDMLCKGALYQVREVATRDGQTGLDIGFPTPWGDRHWNADRFEKWSLQIPQPENVASEKAA